MRMGLEDISCKDLLAEVSRRRKEKEIEINKKYERMARDIKDQFNEFRKLDKKLPGGVRFENVLSHAYGWHDSLLNGSAGAKTKLTFQLTGNDFHSSEYAMSDMIHLLHSLEVELTVPLLLDYWEAEALIKLERKRNAERAELY